MRFLKVAYSYKAPTVRNCMWLKPVAGGFALYVMSGNKWVPVQSVEGGDSASVIDDKPKTNFTVTDITALTTKQCNALNVGDHVIKKTGSQKHLYTVTYKEDKQGMCLTYFDAENAETVAYDWNGTSKVWGYTDTTITPLAS